METINVVLDKNVAQRLLDLLNANHILLKVYPVLKEAKEAVERALSN